MPEYKNIRLEKAVYEELERYQLRRESMSQTVHRLLTILTKSQVYADTLIKNLTEGL